MQMDGLLDIRGMKNVNLTYILAILFLEIDDFVVSQIYQQTVRFRLAVLENVFFFLDPEFLEDNRILNMRSWFFFETLLTCY